MGFRKRIPGNSIYRPQLNQYCAIYRPPASACNSGHQGDNISLFDEVPQQKWVQATDPMEEHVQHPEVIADYLHFVQLLTEGERAHQVRTHPGGLVWIHQNC